MVLQRQFGHHLLKAAAFLAQMCHLTGRRLARRVTGKPLLTGFEKLLRSGEIQTAGYAFAPAQLRYAVFTVQPLPYDPDLLLGGKVSPRLSPDVLDDFLTRRLSFSVPWVCLSSSLLDQVR